MKGWRAYLALLSFGIIMASGTQVASGHNPAVYYDFGLYKSGHHTGLTPDWWFSPDFPGGDFKTRVKNAFSEWNSAFAPMDFDFKGTKSSGYTPYQMNCLNYPYNGVFYRDMPFVDETIKCRHSGKTTLHRFALIIEDRSDCGSSTCKWDVEGGTNDLQGAATHEVGHAAGGLLIFRSLRPPVTSAPGTRPSTRCAMGSTLCHSGSALSSSTILTRSIWPISELGVSFFQWSE